MKTKNVWMPMLAFLVAIGMAFATTPINGFQPEVWTGTGPEDCHETNCMLEGEDICEESGPFHANPGCSQPITDPVYKPVSKP